MFSRTALLLLALTLSQVYAMSFFQQRSIEFLESRQSACDSVREPFSALITTCAGEVTCLCNTAAASMLQSYITCAVTAAPTPNITTAAQNLINTYTRGCTGVTGVPAVTLPATTGSTNTRTSSVNNTLVPSVSSPTSTRRSTVTGATTPPVVVQSTFSSSSTEDNTLPTSTGGVPGIVSSDGRQSYNGKQAGLVVIVGMLCVALVL